MLLPLCGYRLVMITRGIPTNALHTAVAVITRGIPTNALHTAVAVIARGIPNRGQLVW